METNNAKIMHILSNGKETWVDGVAVWEEEFGDFWVEYLDPECDQMWIMDFASKEEVILKGNE